MKYFLPLIFFIFTSAYGATCTTTTRTNYQTGQVLTSSALNADFNQLVTKVNSLDGGCVTDGTLEASALNATDFAVVTNGIMQGCPLSYIDANTVSVGKCLMAVNGAFVKTTTSTNVTWGCPGCSSEVVSTQYYVYAKTGSSGSTLNLLISSTAPNADGYDGSGNKIIGRFFNNSAGAIEQYSVFSWETNGFSRDAGKISTPGVSTPVDSFSFSFGDTNATTVCATATCTYLDQVGDAVTSVTLGGAGIYTINLKRFYTKIKCTGNVNNATAPSVPLPMVAANASTVAMTTVTVSVGQANTYGTIHCEGY